MPGNVVAVLTLGEGQVADGTGRPDVDLLGFVHHDFALLSDEVVVLQQRVQPRVSERHVLSQVV